MNPEISTSLKIIRIIRSHLAEPQCTHNIQQIMIEAMNFEAQEGLVVTSNQNQQDDATVQSAGEQIDNAINRQTTN